MTRISPNHPVGRKLAVVDRESTTVSDRPGYGHEIAALFDPPPATPQFNRRNTVRNRPAGNANSTGELTRVAPPAGKPPTEASITAALSRRLSPPVATPRGLIQADAELAAALTSEDPAEQFRHAHLSAIRSAAAIVEFRGRPHPRMHARTVWEMLTIVEPEFAPWATYFASGAALRAMAESGLGDQIDAMRVAEVTACAEDFRAEVARWFEAAFAANGSEELVDDPPSRPQLRLIHSVAA